MRGLSQLDLALEADVSARHVSFLETGRAEPRPEMVRRLAGALGVPLRDQNELLRAAGHPPAYDEPASGGPLSTPIEQAITRMLEKHEPFPMLLLDRRYDVVRANRAATWLMQKLLPSIANARLPINVFELLFDPEMARPLVVDWERVARAMLARLHRESLVRGGDATLQELLRTLVAYPGVPKEWHAPDLSFGSEPCLSLRFRSGDVELAFLVTVTVFDAPNDVTLEELRLESYFPLDDVTARTCEAIFD